MPVSVARQVRPGCAALSALLLATACTSTGRGPMLAEPYDRPPSLLGCAGYSPVARTDPDLRVGRAAVAAWTRHEFTLRGERR